MSAVPEQHTEFRMGSAEDDSDSEVDVAWDREIRSRISAIDEGRVVGVSYEDVMSAAEARGAV